MTEQHKIVRESLWAFSQKQNLIHLYKKYEATRQIVVGLFLVLMEKVNYNIYLICALTWDE